MTQMEFAQALDVSYATVSRWENGHVRPSRLALKAIDRLVSGRRLVTPSRGPALSAGRSPVPALKLRNR